MQFVVIKLLYRHKCFMGICIFIRNYIRDSRGVFSVSVGMIIDGVFSYVFFTVVCANSQLFKIITRKLHGGLKYESE